eukprot:Partr_v1_DN25152_c3_g1_i2_m76722 putative methionyl-tRNA formyltransferase
MRILFFGTCDFSAQSLRSIIGSRALSHVEVVTPVPQLSTLPLLDFARRNRLTCHQWSSSHNGYPTSHNFDLGVVVSFGYFIPAPLVKSFPKGMINVHPSLLPLYRGAAPIQHALVNGDAETGVSIIDLHTRSFDAGKLLRQTRYNIDPDSMYADVYQQLALLGGEDLRTVIEGYDMYQTNAKEQDMTFKRKRAPKITKDMALINWTISSARSIYNTYRGISHQFHLHSRVNDDEQSKIIYLEDIQKPDLTRVELQLLATKYPLLLNNWTPGTVFLNSITDTLYIRCGSNNNSRSLDELWLGVRRLNSAVVPSSPISFCKGRRVQQFQQLFLPAPT